MMMIIIIIRED